MQRFSATVRQEMHESDSSLSELVQVCFEKQTALSVIAMRETVRIPLELKVNGYARHIDQKTGKMILEFSGVSMTAIQKAFEASGTEPNPLSKPFDLDLDERSNTQR